MSARARSASICRSMRSSPTISLPRPWSSPRASSSAPACRQRLEQAFADDFDNVLTPRQPAGARAPGRLAGQVPRQRARSRQDARAGPCLRAGASATTPTRATSTTTGTSRARSIRIEVDQDRARALGITSQQLANNINAVLSGHHHHAAARRAPTSIDIVARAVPEERAKLDTLRNLMLATSGGRSVPLAQIATHLLRARAAADLAPPAPADRDGAGRRGPGRRGDHRGQAARAGDRRRSAPSCRRAMPSSPAASIEDSAKAQASIFVVFPLMLFLMMTILMVQLMSFQRLFLVLLTAPLALIGVAGGAAHLAARRWASSPSSASSR